MLNLDQVKELLPHREPFLFVDGVVKMDQDSIEAYRDIRPDEFFFKGHFPGNPVFPGVLMVEALAQAGILLVLATRVKRENRNTLFAGIESVRFRRIVRPGERLRLTAKVIGERSGLYKMSGAASVGEELACEATVLGMLR